jgi:hypothetical protein
MSRNGTCAAHICANTGQDGMKHPATRELFAYWDRRRGERSAPDRSDIEPGDIRGILGDTFLLSFDHDAGHPFRLAGTRICALFGRELKGDDFLSLWDDASLLAIDELLAIIAEETVGIVAGAVGRNDDGDGADIEMMLLPLGRPGRLPARLIGSLAATRPAPYWLGARPLRDLALGQFRHVGPAVQTNAAPYFAATPAEGREAHGFVVYDGGRNR